MSRRVTRCITWGEMKMSGAPLLDAEGRRIGMIDWAEYVTVCGRVDEDPVEACTVEMGRRRPRGVCAACWKRFVPEWHAAYYGTNTQTQETHL